MLSEIRIILMIILISIENALTLISTSKPLTKPASIQSTFPASIQFKFLLTINNELAAVLTNDSIRIWLSNFDSSVIFKPTQSAITSIAQLDSKTIMIGTKISEIELFSFSLNNTINFVPKIKISTSNSVNSLVGFNVNAKQYIGSASLDLIQIWETNKFQNIANLTNSNKNSIICLKFDQSSSLLAIGSEDGTILLWNTAMFVRINVLSDHTDKINAIIILDNKTIATASRDLTINIWDLTENKLTKTIQASSSGVLSLVNLNQDWFASGSFDSDIKIWNKSTFESIATLQGHTNAVSALVLMKNNLLASASYDMTIRIWNLTTFATIKSWKNHSQAIFCLALLNNGFLASGSQDRTIKIWNTSNNFQLVYTIYDLSSVFVLLPLPDGRLLSATGSVINVWNTNSNYSLIASLKGHYLSILSLQIFSDNTTLISGSIDNTIKIWDIRSFKLLNTLNTQSAVNSLEVFNETTILSVHDDLTIKIWQPFEIDFASLIPNKPFTHMDSVLAIEFLNNTSYLASGSIDQTIKIWNLLDFNLFATLIGHSNAVTSLVNLPQMMFASASLDQSILVWDIKNNFKRLSNLASQSNGSITSLVSTNQYLFSGSNNSIINKWKINTGIIETVSNSLQPSASVIVLGNDTIVTFLSPNPQFVDKNLNSYNKIYINKPTTAIKLSNTEFATGDIDITRSAARTTVRYLIKFWTIEAKRSSSVTLNHNGPIESLAAINSTVLASGSCDKTIKIWKFSKIWIEYKSLSDHKSCVRALSILENKKLLFSGSDDQKIIIWNVMNNFAKQQTLEGHTGPVLSLDSYKSNWLTSSSADNTIKIWTQSFNQISKVVNNTDDIYAIATLKNGYFATGSVDTTIKIWNINSNNSLQLVNSFEAHSSVVKALDILLTGELVSASYDSTIIVWANASSTSEKKFTLTGHTDTINAIAVLKDGNLVSGSSDFTLRLWNMTKFEQIKQIDTTQVFAITVLQNGTVAYGVREGILNFVHPNSLNEINRIANAHTTVIWALTTLPNGNVVSGSADTFIKIWDSKTFNFITALIGHTDEVFTLVSSATLNFLFSGSLDKTIKVWDINEYELYQTLSGHTDGVEALVVDSNSRLISGSDDNSVIVWDRSDYKNTFNLTGHTRKVQTVKFLDGSRLISGSDDDKLKLWNFQIGQCIDTQTANMTGITALALMSNKMVVGVSNMSTIIKIWDTNLFQKI